MADMKMFSINNGQVKELMPNQVALEKELQKLVEENMCTFFDVTFLKSEYKITNGRMDSIGIDKNNCPVIFEYKRSINESVIAQGLSYLAWLCEHKRDYEFLVMKILGQEKAGSINWNPYVICVANDFMKYDEMAVKMQQNIKLVRYRKFGGDLIAFEYLNSSPVQLPFENTSSQLTKKSSKKDFEQYFAEADDKKKDLFYSIEKFILSLGDDVSEEEKKNYVVFKKPQNFICFRIYKSMLKLRLVLNPDEVRLVSGFVEDARLMGNWGKGDVMITINSPKDFENVQYLIKRAYDQN